MILTISADVQKVDLSSFYKYVDWHDCFTFFKDDMGQNHCKLLAYLSYQLPNGAKVADLGTFLGQSAVPLAANPEVHVITYDIEDFLPEGKTTCKQMPNVFFIKGNCLDYIGQFQDADVVFLDVAPHDGVQEQRIFSELSTRNFRGLLICDDIYYSDPMKSWWASIPIKKLDVTNYGHWSGTGIIVFDPSYIDCVIE